MMRPYQVFATAEEAAKARVTAQEWCIGGKWEERVSR
jgi:hypothetical protein